MVTSGSQSTLLLPTESHIMSQALLGFSGARSPGRHHAAPKEGGEGCNARLLCVPLNSLPGTACLLQVEIPLKRPSCGWGEWENRTQGCLGVITIQRLRGSGGKRGGMKCNAVLCFPSLPMAVAAASFPSPCPAAHKDSQCSTRLGILDTPLPPSVLFLLSLNTRF